MFKEALIYGCTTASELFVLRGAKALGVDIVDDHDVAISVRSVTRCVYIYIYIYIYGMYTVHIHTHI